jgi:cytochrome bd ubiquinol oxidase subunit II
MDLNTVWFVLIAVLYTGYFLLDGFDLGVGILLPFLGKSDLRRRAIIHTIAPHWDGNEVWLITAGGATFAAFPGWYATLFSGFYLPLLLILVALIIRGVALEFRSKDENPLWRSFWDWAIFAGSLVPALLWGVAFANFLRGVPIDGNLQYVGGFWNLLNPYALMGGLFTLTSFILYGALFLSLKTTDELQQSSRKAVRNFRLLSLLSIALFAASTLLATDTFSRLGVVSVTLPVLAILAVAASGIFIRQKREGRAFIATALAILLTMASLFEGLYPRVMVSSLNSEWSLTIMNVSSSPYTLKIMTIIAAIFVPIVMVYQAWAYWIFKKRVNEKSDQIKY